METLSYSLEKLRDLAVVPLCQGLVVREIPCLGNATPITPGTTIADIGESLTESQDSLGACLFFIFIIFFDLSLLFARLTTPIESKLDSVADNPWSSGSLCLCVFFLQVFVNIPVLISWTIQIVLSCVLQRVPTGVW